MFDATHILYMVISAIVTAGLLILAARLCKEPKQKDVVLKVAAVVTVIIHYSNLWVDYLTTGSATVENNHLFMIYPCNVMMWALVVVAFIPRKEGTAFTMLADFVFWVGIVCGSIGIILNTNYDNTPSLLDYDVLKGLLSHSTMLFGCIYLVVGGYVKIRVFNVVSSFVGLLGFVTIGAINNGLFSLFGLGSVNSMYLQEGPIESMPWITPWLMGAVGIALLFIGLALYEMRLPKEERWYSKLRLKIDKVKQYLKREK